LQVNIIKHSPGLLQSLRFLNTARPRL